MTVWSSGIVEMVSWGDLGRRQLAFERSLITVTYLSLLNGGFARSKKQLGSSISS